MELFAHNSLSSADCGVNQTKNIFSDQLEEQDFIMKDEEKQLFKQAENCIARKDASALNQLLTEHPELVTFPNPDDRSQTLLHHTLSYANFVGDKPEFWSTLECAETLINHGAQVEASFCTRAIHTADVPMVDMIHLHGKLPPCLRTSATIGKVREIKTWFNQGELKPDAAPPADWSSDKYDPLHGQMITDELLLADAFRYACRLGRKCAAGFLLEKAMVIDAKFAGQIGGWGKKEFLDYMIVHRGSVCVPGSTTIWELAQVVKMMQAVEEDNLEDFQQVLRDEPSLLSQRHLRRQIDFLELAAYSDGYKFAKALLDAGACVADVDPRPESNAMVYAIDYGNRQMIELLWNLWQPAENLPTAAGIGNTKKVRSFFDNQGKLKQHAALVYPEGEGIEASDRVLVRALALACMNEHLEIATYLVDRGADINGEWSLHEPATILHHIAFTGKLKVVQFLVERGADLSIRDLRYDSDALGWASYNGQKKVVAYLKKVLDH